MVIGHQKPFTPSVYSGNGRRMMQVNVCHNNLRPRHQSEKWETVHPTTNSLVPWSSLKDSTMWNRWENRPDIVLQSEIRPANLLDGPHALLTFLAQWVSGIDPSVPYSTRMRDFNSRPVTPLPPKILAQPLSTNTRTPLEDHSSKCLQYSTA